MKIVFKCKAKDLLKTLKKFTNEKRTSRSGKSN